MYVVVAMNVTLIDYTDDFHIVACTAVAMQRRRIYIAVAPQRFVYHVPAGTDTSAAIELFSVWSVPRYYKQGTESAVREFYTGGCEDRI
jgi:hypothetical protein